MGSSGRGGETNPVGPPSADPKAAGSAPDQRAPQDGETIASGPGSAVQPEDTIASGSARPVSSRGTYVPTFAAGDLVSERYRVVRYIARGGMGEVYEVEDIDLRERIALKTVRAEMAQDEATVQRFKREIHIARKVSHPNVCRIFDLGRHLISTTPREEVLFLTMELLAGDTLQDRLVDQGPMSPEQALPILRQMASALATAHQMGIVHRDFKGANVMLVPAPGGERVVITDFGLARRFADASAFASLTGAGTAVGTPAYMAPEQLEGKDIGPPADIYALGLVMYEMVTGTLPFTGDSPFSVAVKRLTVLPESPCVHVPGLDPRWESAILRCLERDPADRFQSALEVVRAVGGGVGDVSSIPSSTGGAAAAAPPTGATAAPALQPAAAPSKRPAWLLIGGGALALAVIVAGSSWLRSRARAGGTAASPGEGASVSGTATTAAAPVTLRKSVAVLGFKNLGRPDAAWLSTAIAEMLRTELTAGGKLRPIPGETVTRMRLEMKLADTDSLARDTLGRIRANCGADYVVLGSYLTTGKGLVRVDMRLQETAQGETLASAPAEGTEEEIFKLVSDAGSKLRDALGVGAISDLDAKAARATFPTSPAAAQAYSEGLAKLGLFDALEARRLLEKATAAEPNHPLPHAALARAWSALGYDEKAKAASRRAMDLSSNLPREDRLAVQAQHYETTTDWARAVETYKALQVFFPDRLDYGLGLAAALTAAGRGKEALDSVEELRRLPRPASDDPRLDLAEAAAAKALTDFARQQRAAVAAAAKAEKQGALLTLAQARLAQGTALVNLGRLQEARQACERSGEVFAAAGDGAGVARSENIVAVAFAQSGDFAQAKERFEAALKAFRRIGDQRGIALQLGNVANTEIRLGAVALARAHLEEAIAVSREIADGAGLARSLSNLATLLEEQGQLDAALAKQEEALQNWKRVGARAFEALVLANIGEIYRKKGLPGPARQKFEESLRISQETGARTADTAWAHTQLATMLAQSGDLETAERELNAALAIHRESDDRTEQAAVLRALASLRERGGDKAGAKSFSDEAARLAPSPSPRGR